MKQTNFLLIGTFVVLSMQVSTWADGDHSAPPGGPKFSEHSAVSAFDAEEGFKMSGESLKSLGVRFSKLEGKAPWSLPKNALVQIKHSTGVYRRVQGWISFVLVEVKSKKGAAALIQSEDLQAGDEVAVEGAPFLRMTEADLNADTVDNCAH